MVWKMEISDSVKRESCSTIVSNDRFLDWGTRRLSSLRREERRSLRVRTQILLLKELPGHE